MNTPEVKLANLLPHPPVAASVDIGNVTAAPAPAFAAPEAPAPVIVAGTAPEIKLPTQQATPAIAAPAPELPATKIVAGTALKCGQYIELAGVAIYQVNKVPSQIERKDKDPVEIPGSASLVQGNCTQRYIELWPSRNYHRVDYKPAGSVVRQSPVQKGSTTTDTMTTSKPQA